MVLFWIGNVDFVNRILEICDLLEIWLCEGKYFLDLEIVFNFWGLWFLLCFLMFLFWNEVFLGMYLEFWDLE